MQKNIKVLYISYDGMTDPLGQSQVIPYLQQLQKKGAEIHILSAEKANNYHIRNEFIGKLLKESNLHWHPVNYTKTPPVISTMLDINKIVRYAKKLHKKHNFDIVHCRSYISAFAGIALKKKFGVKFLFDMRGFYADERVDGNLWPRTNPVFNSVYKYFKKKEKTFFQQADYTISLTYAGKDIIHKFPEVGNIPIEVIPCCADLDLFDYNNSNTSLVEKFRQELQISSENYIISYLGSIGTWYMPDEMLRFFKILKSQKPNSKFLFITRDDPKSIYSLAEEHGINKTDIIIRPANREEVPALLSLSNASIFFIKPVFSKKASSPTKLAELMGMGIPVVCNSDVGDIDKFVPENNLGIMVENMDDQGLLQAVNEIEKLDKIERSHSRNVAENLFSLKIGAERYYSVYQKLINS